MADRRPLPVEIGEGLAFVVRQPLLRRIVATTGGSNLFGAASSALLVLYVVRELGPGGTDPGLVLGGGALGGVAGALLTVSGVVLGVAVVVYDVAQVSFRQRLCPRPLPGWMNASVRFVVRGARRVGRLSAGRASAARAAARAGRHGSREPRGARGGRRWRRPTRRR